MKLVKLTYTSDFIEILKNCQNETVGKVLTMLEGKQFFLDYNDINVIMNSDKVEFLNLTKNVKISMKVGRFVTKLLTDTCISQATYSAYDIERFVYIWKGFANFEEMSKDFEIVNGEDIRKYYNHRNYAAGGSLSESCMKHEQCQPYLDIYCENPKQINMLILKNGYGKITGRAIIWKNVNHRLKEWDKKQKEVVTFMDRIYSTEESVVEMFKIYAKKMGWLYKYRQQIDDDTPIVQNSKVISNSKLFFYLDNVLSYDSSFPFMDTMRNYSLENGFISNKPFKGSVELCNTSGEYTDNN